MNYFLEKDYEEHEYFDEYDTIISNLFLYFYKKYENKSLLNLKDKEYKIINYKNYSKYYEIKLKVIRENIKIINLQQNLISINNLHTIDINIDIIRDLNKNYNITWNQEFLKYFINDYFFQIKNNKIFVTSPSIINNIFNNKYEFENIKIIDSLEILQLLNKIYENKFRNVNNFYDINILYELNVINNLKKRKVNLITNSNNIDINEIEEEIFDIEMYFSKFKK